MDRPAIKVWQNNDNHWVNCNFSLTQNNETLNVVRSLLKKGAMKDLNDFDNFLDDTENDWTNSHLNIDFNKLLAMY